MTRLTEKSSEHFEHQKSIISSIEKFDDELKSESAFFAHRIIIIEQLRE